MQLKQNIVAAMTAWLLLPGLPLVVDARAEYPDKAIRLLVGFPAGSATDILGRLVAKGLETELGRPVAVINQPGAGGALAYDQLRRATPDGYTIGWVTGSLFTATNIGNLQWGYEGLTPVARIAQWPLVVGVRTEAPWKSWPEFLADARQHPGKYKFGHAGTGSVGHLMNVALSSGVAVVHVPIGADRRFPALLGGQIDLLSAPAADLASFSAAGQVRALVAGSAARIPSLPDTPTATEIGIDFQMDLLYGVFTPPETPAEITGRLRKALATVTAGYQPLRDYAAGKEMSLDYLDGPELETWLAAQNATIAKVMQVVDVGQPPAAK